MKKLLIPLLVVLLAGVLVANKVFFTNLSPFEEIKALAKMGTLYRGECEMWIMEVKTEEGNYYLTHCRTHKTVEIIYSLGAIALGTGYNEETQEYTFFRFYYGMLMGKTEATKEAAEKMAREYIKAVKKSLSLQNVKSVEHERGYRLVAAEREFTPAEKRIKELALQGQREPFTKGTWCNRITVDGTLYGVCYSEIELNVGIVKRDKNKNGYIVGCEPDGRCLYQEVAKGEGVPWRLIEFEQAQEMFEEFLQEAEALLAQGNLI